jgi:hypothetical protein
LLRESGGDRVKRRDGVGERLPDVEADRVIAERTPPAEDDEVGEGSLGRVGRRSERELALDAGQVREPRATARRRRPLAIPFLTATGLARGVGKAREACRRNPAPSTTVLPKIGGR